MAGNIVYKGNGKFRFRVSSGTGKDRRFAEKIFNYTGKIDEEKIKSKEYPRAVETALAEFVTEVRKGLYVDNAKIKFSDFVEIWDKNHASKKEPKTYHRYREMLNSRILPAIGHIQLSKLNPTHLLNFYDNLSEVGIPLKKTYTVKDDFFSHINREGKTLKEISEVCEVGIRTLQTAKKTKKLSGIILEKICKGLEISKRDSYFILDENNSTLSDRTISHHHKLISSILEKAVQWQYLLMNPATRVDPPKVVKKEAPHFDETQTMVLLKLLRSEPIKYVLAVTLTIYTGLREGELTGLKWDSIDIKNKMLTVKQASQYVPSTGRITKDPKNETSIRTLVLPSEVMPLIKKYKVWWETEKNKCGDNWFYENDDKNDPGYVFVQSEGNPMFPDTPGKWFAKFIKRKGLPHITFHGLRHTHATLLIGDGVDIQSVSSRLGHSTATTTLNIYSHRIKSKDKIAAEKIGKILKNKKEENKKQA
jgi:integrase